MSRSSHVVGCDTVWCGFFGGVVPPHDCPTCDAIEAVETNRMWGWDDFAIVEAMCASPTWRSERRSRGPLSAPAWPDEDLFAMSPALLDRLVGPPRSSATGHVMVRNSVGGFRPLCDAPLTAAPAMEEVLEPVETEWADPAELALHGDVCDECGRAVVVMSR